MLQKDDFFMVIEIPFSFLFAKRLGLCNQNV